MGSIHHFHTCSFIVCAAVLCQNVRGHFLREQAIRSGAERYHILGRENATPPGHFLKEKLALPAAQSYLWRGNLTQPGAEAHGPEAETTPSDVSFQQPTAVATPFKTDTTAGRIYWTAGGRGASDKYPIIMFFHRQLEKAFGKQMPYWYQDWKIWVGVALWFSVVMKWTFKGYDQIYYIRGLFCFGLNIMILHTLQYSENIRMGMMGVCVVLVTQCLVQAYLWFKSEVEARKANDFTDFLCDTLYLDLSLPILQIIVLFVAQFCVWWFYMSSIVAYYAMYNFDRVNYMFWLVAYLTMQMTMIFNRGEDSALGNPFPMHEVHRLYMNCGHTQYSYDEEEPPVRLSKCNILLRGVMGFFTNAILREIMSYTIPLMLMEFEEPMDFVVYCVGVNFICTLDDMSEKKYSMVDLSPRPQASEG